MTGEEREARCQVCGDDVCPPVKRCPRCDTPFHEDCWEYNEGCAVYGCEAALMVVQAQVEERLQAEPSPDRLGFVYLRLSMVRSQDWLYLGVLVFFLGLALAGLAGRGQLFWSEPWKSLACFLTALAFLGAGTSVSLFSWVLPDFFTGLAMASRLGCVSREETIRRLEQRLKRDPKSFHLLDLLGSALFAEGCFREAVEAYDRALALRPEEQRLHIQKGQALTRLERNEEALKAFHQVLYVNPATPMATKARFWIGVLEGRGRSERPRLIHARQRLLEAEKARGGEDGDGD